MQFKPVLLSLALVLGLEMSSRTNFESLALALKVKSLALIGDLKLSKELKKKLLGSDREGLGVWLGIRIADLNQLGDLKLSILAPVKYRSPC